MDIQKFSLTAALELFSINCSVRPREIRTCLTKLSSTFLSLSLAHTLSSNCEIMFLCFPTRCVRFIFQSGRRLSGFFSFKDRIPKLMRSRIIYKYSCQCYRALYFGQTRRHFHTRISEHMGVSPLSGKKLAKNSLSSVLAHSQQSLHRISPDDFTIISSCRSNSNFELLREEAS